VGLVAVFLPKKRTLTKEELIAKFLQTEEGRRKLAASMLSPVRCGGLDYDKFGQPRYRHSWGIPRFNTNEVVGPAINVHRDLPFTRGRS